MTRIADRHPIGEFVVQQVAVIEKAAELQVKASRLGAGRPVIQPTGRTPAIRSISSMPRRTCSRSASSGIVW